MSTDGRPGDKPPRPREREPSLIEIEAVEAVSPPAPPPPKSRAGKVDSKSKSTRPPPPLPTAKPSRPPPLPVKAVDLVEVPPAPKAPSLLAPKLPSVPAPRPTPSKAPLVPATSRDEAVTLPRAIPAVVPLTAASPEPPTVPRMQTRDDAPTLARPVVAVTPLAPPVGPLPQLTTTGARPLPPSSPKATGPVQTAAFPPMDAGRDDTLVLRELRARVDHLVGDSTLAARALVELGLFEERARGDRRAAKASYDLARGKSQQLAPALVRARRLLELPAERAAALSLLDQELAVTNVDARRADLLAEKARVLELLGRLPDARAAYGEALRVLSSHPAALRGLETTLRRQLLATPDAAIGRELAQHLERLAEAYASGDDGDTALASWLFVERAELLDGLGDTQPAASAFEHAIALAPAPGPAREAYKKHLLRHKDDRGLARALEAEAAHEPDDERAAALLYIAARVRADRLREPSDAAADLRLGLDRAAFGGAAARRSLRELIRILEETGESSELAEAREQYLARLSEPAAVREQRLHLLALAESDGRDADAVVHAAEALRIDGSDHALRERLDVLLSKLGRHDDRLQLWLDEANGAVSNESRALALRNAAAVAEHALHAPEEARRHLATALLLAPEDPIVLDALAALHAPPRREADETRGVAARIELHTQAAASAKDPVRRVAHLEKVAGIWEDELSSPERALAVVERILALEPGRRSALLAEQRNARRAGDFLRLSRSLGAEAALTADKALARRLWLDAADHLAASGSHPEALERVERAALLGADHPDVLTAKAKHSLAAGRVDDARAALAALVGVTTPAPEKRDLYARIARLDETARKKPKDAAAALRKAAQCDPQDPAIRAEIARLDRKNGDHTDLAASLHGIAKELSGDAKREVLVEAAEIEELLLGDDRAAQRSLEEAAGIDGAADDPWISSALERIAIRTLGATEQETLYARLIGGAPPQVAARLRISLAKVIADKRPPAAVELLGDVLDNTPGHVPAVRLLGQIHRARGDLAGLPVALRLEADVVVSRPARIGALWELVKLESQLGPSATLEALERIVALSPGDTAALDAIVRVAGSLPGDESARAALASALGQQRELTADFVSRALLHAEEALLHEEESATDVSSSVSALSCYRASLEAAPDGLLAASGLSRLAVVMSDASSLLVAKLALARLAASPRDEAGHLLTAAELTEAEGRLEEARLLYEDALRRDPESPAAASVARLDAGDVTRLVDRLGEALEAARTSAQVSLLGVAIGRAVLESLQEGTGGPDATVGIVALRRALVVSDTDDEARLLLGRLYVEARLWPEARETFHRVAETARDAASRLYAHFELAGLYRGALADLPRAEAELRAVLSLDPQSTLALEHLHQVGLARGDRSVAIEALERLAALATSPGARVELDMRLSESCREAGDPIRSVRALCDAIMIAPDDARPWGALARRYRTDSQEGAVGYVHALETLLAMAESAGAPISAHWLTTLGLIEANILFQHDAALGHLRRAVALPGAPPSAEVALGRGLEAAGAHAEAIRVLVKVLTAEGDGFARGLEFSPALGALEASYAKDGRAEERLSVEEARACFGEVSAERMAMLRARRLGVTVPTAGSLSVTDLRRLLPPAARTPMVDVAIAIAPVVGKALRFELSSLGLPSRDRLASRDGHPTRLLADRIARAMGIEDLELYVSSSWKLPLRVFPADPMVLVAPAMFADLPELEQVFALARTLARAALGVPWLDDLAVDQIDGLLVAALRAADGSYASVSTNAPREAAARAIQPSMTKAMGRRQRKAIEEIAREPEVPYDPRQLVRALRKAELRAGYVACGALVACVDYTRRVDQDLSRAGDDPHVLATHPATSELLRFALTPDALAERRRVGTIWLA